MKDRSSATSGTRPRPGAAIIAAVLAFALAFMAFEPGSLRSAFADEGKAASSEASHQESGTMQATEPVDSEADQADESLAGEQAALGDGNAAEGEAEDAEQEGPEPGAAQAHDARAGPEDEGASPADLEPQGQESDEETPESSSGAGCDDCSPVAAQPSEQAAAASKARASYASCTVTFYSNVESAAPSILARKLVSAVAGQTAAVIVSDVVAQPPTSAQVFDGWTYDGRTHTDSIEVNPEDGNVKLYPAFASGHWLRFVAGEAESGAVTTPSQFVGANDSVPNALPTTLRDGYAFEGWFEGSMENGAIAYGNQVTHADGTVIDVIALKDILAQRDVTLYAKWRGIQTTYRVIVWHENPDDEYYSFYSADTIGDQLGEQAVSGEMTNVSDLPSFEGFELARADDTIIEGDGSTVVHAYYDRIEYFVYFHDGRSYDDAVFDELTFSAKYGADVRDKWPQSDPNGAFTSSWYTLPGTEDTFVNGLVTMPLGGAHFYLKKDTGYNFNTVFHVQAIDGSNNFTTYLEQRFGSSFVPGTTPDDYMPLKGFMVNAASADDARKIREITTGDKAATHNPDFSLSTPVGVRYNNLPQVTKPGDIARYTADFYYLRCQYDIVFEENGGPEAPDVQDVYYEASLEGLEPDEYVVGETTYAKQDGETFVFAGWYSNDELVGDAFDFASQTMPPNNVVLYAKWKPARYLVQVDPDGGEFANDGQSTYFWVDHGEKISYIHAERDYVADDDGTHVYDYETASADTDGFGVAEYVEASAEDTGQRYRYSEDAYSLYGWYRADDYAHGEIPFDFDQGIVEDTMIVARWQAAGVFDIAYDPSVEIDGVTVSGDIHTMLDAGYVDLSPTVIMNTPVDIEASDGRDYQFLGWQVVEGFDMGDGALVDQLFVEGDGFIVNSELARNNTIHLQAVYEQSNDPVVDPGDTEQPDDSPSNPDTGATEDLEADGDDTFVTVEGDTVEGDTVEQRVSRSPSELPKTGDEAQSLAVGIGGMALAALGVALIARAMRRSGTDEEAQG